MTSGEHKASGLSYACGIRLAEIPVCFRFHFQEAYEYFRSYEDKTIPADTSELLVSDEEWTYFLKRGVGYTSQAEASLLTAFASDHLMHFDAVILHAVAFVFRGKAWLITGESGAGKSTQVHNLQSLVPGEFSVICGDRPVIRLMEDGQVFVFPSPWNGKEGWKGADAAPLEGIICLTRGEENLVEEMPLRHAVVSVYKAVIHTARTEAGVLRAAELEGRILETCRIYKMVSRDIPQSSELLREKVFR